MKRAPSEYDSIYKKISREENPESRKINRGPFQLFVIIDGHNGDVIAKTIEKYIMEIIIRNRNIMVKRRYDKGLREIFIKMEELLA